MPDKLTLLNCWVRSESVESILQVDGNLEETTVYALKEKIKNKDPAILGGVGAHALVLYKPKHPLSEPHEDKLSELILSKDAEHLKGTHRLSNLFTEQPPEDDIHIIVDAPSRIVCWLRRAALNDSFRLPIHPGEYIDDLIPRILAKPNLNVANQPIRLYKISGDENRLQGCLNKIGDGALLQSGPLTPNFLDVPVLDPLRIVIEIPVAGDGSPTLVQEPISDVEGVQEYKHIFVKVKDWGKFEESDIRRNHIVEAGNMDIPAFVSTFEARLDQKPRFSLDVMQTLSIPDEYFEPHENSTSEGSQEEKRCADLWEVTHTACYVAHYAWKRCWQHPKPLKEPTMDMIFFGPFLSVENRQNTALRAEDWPLYVVVKRDVGDEVRQYLPRSDFLIKMSTLPRLLVEVNSAPQAPFPKDLVRMLATGAFLVRFANNFVSTFKQQKNFVLCAFYIWADGTATRHILFQIPNDEKVYYRKKKFKLDNSLDRVQFVRHLYNLRSESDQGQDEDAMDAIAKLRSKVEQTQMKSMYTKTDGNRARKRSRIESNHGDPAGGGDGNGHTAQLRAHGYEVEPKVFIDDSGGEWKPLYKTPDHILTVYRHVSGEEFIAKKVRKGSNELDILKFLDTMRLKSDLSDWSIHVISLVDSFDGWAILPKMATLQNYLDWNREAFESHVPQACLGLIKGLAYLHEILIAHRDIKPDNLVVDKKFTLKIIDFDVAIRLKDQDQEVDDQCGTEGWMAPEVKKLSYSPIKADRWSCGQVLLFLLDRFGKEESSLRTFARDLMAHDPKQRPLLLRWAAPPFSDLRNSVASKASQLRRERVEGDGEITKLTNVKKRRLDLGQCNMDGFRGCYGLGFMAGAHVGPTNA